MSLDDLAREQQVVEVYERESYQASRQYCFPNTGPRDTKTQPDHGINHADKRLDGRVAGRDWRLAGSAMPSQDQPRNDGDIVERAHPGPTAQAARGRFYNRTPGWDTVDDDVGERPDQQAEHAEY